MQVEYKFWEDYGPYSRELIANMYKKRLCGMPVGFFILDLRKTNTRCMLSSAILAYVIPGAVRVTGDIVHIKGNNKWHCWVECGEDVWDTTKGLWYKKDVWYKYQRPENLKVDSRKETIESLGKAIEYAEAPDEMYVAFIRDMEGNLDNNPYKLFLQKMIDVFAKEKNLEEKDLDESLVQKYLEELKEAERKVQEYLREQGGGNTFVSDENKHDGEEH